MTTPSLSPEELAEYLLDLGGALLSYGCPTHRLDTLIAEIAALEGYQADAFAVPTGLWMTLRAPGKEPVTRMVRVNDWSVDLGRLVAMDRIFNDVLERRLTLAEARQKLDEVEARPPPYPPPLAWFGAAAASGASAIFFRGGWREAALAAVGGLLVGVLGSLLRRSTRARLLEDFLGGLLAAGSAWAATWLDPSLSRQVLVLSVAILLLPGMALTSGLAELANKNLVSGASRLMEAFMSFLSILIGVAVVVSLERLAGHEPAAQAVAAAAAPGLLVQVAALALAAAGFAVLFSVPRALLHTAMLSCAVAWAATGLGTRSLPGSLVAFIASFALGVVANGLARSTNRPAQLYMLPGLVLLVPGSFGFRSLESFLGGELAGGASEGFAMVVTAGAIVTGVLCANVVLPARKLL